MKKLSEYLQKLPLWTLMATTFHLILLHSGFQSVSHRCGQMALSTTHLRTPPWAHGTHTAVCAGDLVPSGTKLWPVRDRSWGVNVLPSTHHRRDHPETSHTTPRLWPYIHTLVLPFLLPVPHVCCLRSHTLTASDTSSSWSSAFREPELFF
jgi:hypothetical protein